MDIMSEYNLKNFNEIMSREFKGYDSEIDEKELEEFKLSVDHYFNLYAPDDEEFREFYKDNIIISNLYCKKTFTSTGNYFFKWIKSLSK
jgi:uncharacterized protein YajQ (UPF0234 family)